jgi:hypothetical protein
MSRRTLTFASGILLIGLHAIVVAGRGSSDRGPRRRSSGSKPNSGSGCSSGVRGVGGLSPTDGFREERPAVAAGEARPDQPVADRETGSRGSTAARPEGAALSQPASRVTHWPAQLCVLAAISLQVGLSHQLTVGPRWLLPSLEGVLLIGPTVTTPSSPVHGVQPVRQRVGIGLIALVNAANAISLYLLAHEPVYEDVSNGRWLIFSGLRSG